MADPIIVKVSELPELTDLATGDLITAVDISEAVSANKTKKLQAGNLKVFTDAQLTNGVVTNPKLGVASVNYQKIDGLTSLQTSDKLIFFDQSTGKFGYLTWSALTISDTAVVDKAVISFILAEELEPVETGQKKLLWPVPSIFSGYTVKSAIANILTTSTSGKPTFDIRRGRRSSPTSGLSFLSMFTTKITIDVGEYSSTNAAVPAVFNSFAALATDDVLSFDVSIAGVSTKGLIISLELWK